MSNCLLRRSSWPIHTGPPGTKAGLTPSPPFCRMEKTRVISAGAAVSREPPPTTRTVSGCRLSRHPIMPIPIPGAKWPKQANTQTPLGQARPGKLLPRDKPPTPVTLPPRYDKRFPSDHRGNLVAREPLANRKRSAANQSYQCLRCSRILPSGNIILREQPWLACVSWSS